VSGFRTYIRPVTIRPNPKATGRKPAAPKSTRKPAVKPAARPAPKSAAKPAPPPPQPAQRPAHRPPYVPTDQARRTVEAMAAGNLGQDEICMVLRISAMTLRKHFRHELDTAFIRAQDTMWRSLFNQGVGSPARKGDPARGIPATPATPPNVKATIAWLEFRANASKRVTVVDGGTEVDPKKLSDTEIAAHIARLSRTGVVSRAIKKATNEG
jgi:hypothetical protein